MQTYPVCSKCSAALDRTPGEALGQGRLGCIEHDHPERPCPSCAAAERVADFVVRETVRACGRDRARGVMPPVPRVSCTEGALLLSMARNLAGRAELYRDVDDRLALLHVAHKLTKLAERLGPDPLGIGEGVRS